MIGTSDASYRCGLAIIHPKMLFQCLVDVSGTLKHARCCAADHDVVLAHFSSVEHGVEGRNLIHSDGRDI